MEVRLEITIPGKLKDEPLICNLCKTFDIILNIIEASFSTEIGWAILVIKGKEEECKRVLDYLNNKGAKLENIEVS